MECRLKKNYCLEKIKSVIARDVNVILTLSTFTVSLYEHTLKEQRSSSKVPRVKILFQLMLHFTEYLLLSYPTRKISIIVQISKSFVYFSTYLVLVEKNVNSF